VGRVGPRFHRARRTWKFKTVCNPKRHLSDHAPPVKYAMKLPTLVTDKKQLAKRLYVLPANGRAAQENKLITGEAHPAWLRPLRWNPPSLRSGWSRVT
jgi:hypothetical protein